MVTKKKRGPKRPRGRPRKYPEGWKDDMITISIDRDLAEWLRKVRHYKEDNYSQTLRALKGVFLSYKELKKLWDHNEVDRMKPTDIWDFIQNKITKKQRELAGNKR